MVNSENFTAIDRVAATRSKSDEFSEFTILVIEIVSLLCLKPPKWCCTFWDPDSVIVPVVYLCSHPHNVDTDTEYEYGIRSQPQNAEYGYGIRIRNTDTEYGASPKLHYASK